MHKCEGFFIFHDSDCTFLNNCKLMGSFAAQKMRGTTWLVRTCCQQASHKRHSQIMETLSEEVLTAQLDHFPKGQMLSCVKMYQAGSWVKSLLPAMRGHSPTLHLASWMACIARRTRGHAVGADFPAEEGSSWRDLLRGGLGHLATTLESTRRPR
jgi:hypothetical protein